ncbi:MAG: hypothetical protein QOE11_1472, partial [Solirubrobacteraceae bacterium]|nr:hypothetical protein [Solirubrobacteraceae bacterium]
LGVLEDAGDSGLPIRDALLEDGIVASLLLIHGLYPVSLEERVVQALDSMRPYMATHGGTVELLGVEDGVARLRLGGSCKGCPSSAATLEFAIKEAIDIAAPDLLGLEVEGVVGLSEDAAEPAGLSLPMVQVGAPTEANAASPYTECPSGVGK